MEIVNPRAVFGKFCGDRDGILRVAWGNHRNLSQNSVFRSGDLREVPSKKEFLVMRVWEEL